MRSYLEKIKNLKSFKRCNSGVAAIEFAILIPIFLLLTAGIINYGYIMYVQHTMQDVADNTLRSVIYGEIDTSVATEKASDELADLHGSFDVQVQENAKTDDITVTIVADAKSSTLMPFPLVSADLLIGEFSVSLTSPRITRFNPAQI